MLAKGFKKSDAQDSAYKDARLQEKAHPHSYRKQARLKEDEAYCRHN